MSFDDQTPGMGHNSGAPAGTVAAILERLRGAYAALHARFNELTKTAADVPDEITDEDTATKVSDLIKLMKAAIKDSEKSRVSEKEPYLAGGNAVDGFFNKPRDAMDKLARGIEARLTKYLQAKAAREKQEREAAAAREREEAQRKFNEASTAAAEAAKAQADADAATTAAAAAGASLDEATDAAERAKSMRDYWLGQARNALQAGDGKAHGHANAMVEKFKAEAETFHTRAVNLRKELDAKRFEERQKQKAAEDAARATAQAQEQAANAEKHANRADAQVSQKAADMSRTRGDLGSVSSLRTEWTFAHLDRATLDLEALREHIPADALEKAVRSFIKAGGRKLQGVMIFEDTKAVVR